MTDDSDLTRSLGHIVRGEAHRMLSEAQIAPDPERLADGWERRFIADGQRAEEMMALYAELGFEVVADPVRSEQMTGECHDCKLLMLLEFKTIYTRRREDRESRPPVDPRPAHADRGEEPD